MGGKGEGWEVAVNTEVGVQPVPLETIKSQERVTAVELDKEAEGSRRWHTRAGGSVRKVHAYVQKYLPRTRLLPSMTDEDTNIQMVRSLSKIT